jgi:hypothetical protein
MCDGDQRRQFPYGRYLCHWPLRANLNCANTLNDRKFLVSVPRKVIGSGIFLAKGAYKHPMRGDREARRAHHPDVEPRARRVRQVANDYARVYDRILSQVREPVIIH